VRIGAVLADARWRTHLTVDEVSRRTKIREAVIWGIEQDDFSVCGGDAYARGHIRAIAQAVEIDAEPLIRQYDQTYRANEDTGAAAPPPPPPPPSPGHDPQPTRRRRLVITTALAVVVLGLIGWGAYHVATGVGHPAHSQAVAAAGHPSASHSAGVVGVAGQGSPQPSPTPTTPSASSTPSASPTPTPSPTHAAATPSKALSLASVTPFGPGGEGTGDNPQTADLAIDGSSGSAWHSDWYTSAAFGNLKSGTGLLIDLGRGATINDADLDLGGYSGADLQLQAGNSPVPSALHEVASARDAGSTVRLNVGHSARARYVVIWFTQLPPDGNGTYQADVSHVIIRGHY
jgi:cytoskeletal protein RodZ